MRLAAASCAIAITLFLAVFGYLVADKAAILQPTAPTATPASAPSEPVVVRAVTEIAAPPAPETSLTIAQRSNTPEAPAPAARLAPPAEASVAVAQAAPPAAQPSAAPPPAAAPAKASCPGNPNALGIARMVEIDTTGGPGFGFEHFREHDFLRPGEVVLTFDDGPWPQRTMAVVNALAAHCTKAVFFPIGKHATYEPGILKQVAAAGHAIGSHTWSHLDLSKKSFEDAKDEIEKGISAVAMAVGGPTAPYFRFPALRHPPELVKYLGERNVAIFSTDMDSFDFKMRRPEQVRQAVLAKLKKFGKGIVLMHDFQQATAAAAANLLGDLKANGYRVVFMKPKDPVKTIAPTTKRYARAAARFRPPAPARLRAWFAPSASEALRRERRRIAQGRSAGHQFGEEPPGHRTERQPPMGMTIGEPQAGLAGRGADHRA
jgi:peptidoglycan/xylan/chitin deacetylase (PgdA/CDA1 family)